MTFAVFATLQAATSADPGALALGVTAFALATAPLFVLAARRYPVATVLRAALFFDTFMVSGIVAGLGRADLLPLAYVWAITIAALAFGPRETLFFAALGVVGVLVVPQVSPIDIDVLTIVVDLMVLALAGAFLAALSHNAREAQAALARERAYDEAALRIAERIRSSLDLDEILTATVAELGAACDASRALLRIAPRADGSAPLYEWLRPGVEPLRELGVVSPGLPAQRIFETGEPLVVSSREEADEELRDYLDSVKAEALVGYPLVWQGRMLGAVGFQDDRGRDWTAEVVPLLERVTPQIAAALAQAEVFEQQRATLERLEELARLREETIANVSHELRTPLTSTLGFLHTLRRAEFDEGEKERFLSIAISEAERLKSLVDDLLELSRLEHRALPLNRRPVDIASLAERALQGLEFPPGRAVHAELNEGLVVEADSDRILQVLTNLVSNAVRHGAGDVVLHGERKDGHITLEVSDESAGIPPDRVADLFVPFARVGDSSDTGLGLAIARAIVEAHGGTISYRPRAEERPHAFVVSLPAAQPTSAA